MTEASTTHRASVSAAAEAAAPRRSLVDWAIWAALPLALVWSWGPADMDRWTYLFTDSGNMAEYASGFLSPDFSDWRFYLEEMVVTVQIALWGTFLAVLLSIPFGILSADNMAPWWIKQRPAD